MMVSRDWIENQIALSKKVLEGGQVPDSVSDNAQKMIEVMRELLEYRKKEGR